MKNHSLSSRIGRRLALLALGIGLVLVPIVSGLYLQQSYTFRVAHIESQLDDIANASLPGLQEALWLGDDKLVNSQLAGIKNFRDMALVQMEQPNKPRQIVGTRPPVDTPLVERQLEIRKRFMERDVPLGTLTLVVSLESLRAEVHHDAWLIVLSEALQVAIIAGLILFAYQRMAGRRLRRMVDYLDAYRQGDTHEHMPLADGRRQQDELDMLAASFNGLLDEQERNFEKLRASNASLTQEIAFRREAEQALSESRDAAEAANHAKSVFLANMSHELRTPLNAILGFAQLMEHDNRIPADEQRNLQTINRSGQHLLSLINDVLEISRIETGRSSVHVQDFDLHELVESVTESMALRARGKGLALKLEMEPGMPRYLAADLGKLRQVLLNLLSNAVKYTEQGTISLKVSLQLEYAQAQLTIEVRDSGAGIEAVELKKIFQPFYQTEHGIRLGEGTGLGLAICNEYAKLLGGQLSAESTPGLGSVFRFTQPVTLAALPEMSAPRPGHVAALAPGQPSYRILVAEDNEDNQRLAVEMLKRAGFEVCIASNGQEAVELFQSWAPHFIFMDMRMPVLDGYAATQAIRALPGSASAGIPIVALTASAFEEDRPRILTAGCNDILSKPIQSERLFESLARHLGLVFEYESNDLSRPPTTAQLDLSALTPALRQRLHEAAVSLDADAVRDIANEIAATQPETAMAIHDRVEHYHFEELQTSPQENQTS